MFIVAAGVAGAEGVIVVYEPSSRKLKVIDFFVATKNSDQVVVYEIKQYPK
jgi:hypothetical protein